MLYVITVTIFFFLIIIEYVRWMTAKNNAKNTGFYDAFKRPIYEDMEVFYRGKVYLVTELDKDNYALYRRSDESTEINGNTYLYAEVIELNQLDCKDLSLKMH